MSTPPITYQVTLADLIMFADAACDLDGLQGLIQYNPAERERIADMAQRMHDTVERAAGAEAFEIYGADETCIKPQDAEAPT